MRRPLLLALFGAPLASAQDADTLTAADGWRQSLVAGPAGNQAAFAIWQEGGVDALAVAGSLGVVLERTGMENVTLRSRVASFQSFGQIGGSAPDAVSETVLLLREDRLLHVTLDGAAVCGADVSPDAQLREALRAGVSVGLL